MAVKRRLSWLTRSKKLIPTEDGIKLITVLPDFMADIRMMISAIINADYEVSDEQRA